MSTSQSMPLQANDFQLIEFKLQDKFFKKAVIKNAFISHIKQTGKIWKESAPIIIILTKINTYKVLSVPG